MSAVGKPPPGVRKWLTVREQIDADGGRVGGPPLVKAAAAAVITNPYAGRWCADLGALVDVSGALAEELVRRALAALAAPAESCGKAAIVGTAGEQEHGVACLGTPVGEAIRAGIDGITWVPSNTKVAPPGTPVDVPLAYKRALFVRSHYDTLTVALPDAPRPDEIMFVIALASRGRLHHRVGGLSKDEATRGDGLR